MAEKAIDPGILASRRYWAEREEENRRATIRDEKEYAKGIREVLEKAAANIQKEIDAFYGRYAAREGITISDAKMRVSTLDIKEYSRKAKQYVADKDFSKQANEEMRIYNLTMKINRLEMLKSNIGLELCASYSELENYFEDSLTKTARKEFRRQAGILGGTVANMEKHAGEIVNGSFRGAKFSERLWANQAYLKTQLDNLLRTGLIQGRNPRELAKSLRKEIETSVYVSERLMRTEMCRVQIGAQLASYQNMGYDKLVIIPEHDERSCDYCETQDGVIVEVAKAVPGVNVPPFHPNCRCSTAAWADEEKEKSMNGDTREEKETELLLLDKKNMYNSMDSLYNRVRYVKELSDHDDIFIHGNATGVCYKDADGKEIDIPDGEFVRIVKSLNLKKEKIRLCSCNTGALENGFAQLLADTTGKEVLAPTKFLWIYPPDKNGVSEMVVAGETESGRPNMEDLGDWKPFTPHVK